VRTKKSHNFESDSSRGVLDDLYAENRSKKNEYSFRLKTRAGLVVDLVNTYCEDSNGLHLLDFGAAEGRTLLEINKSLVNCNFLGVEFSEELLSAAINLPRQVRLIKGDICKLPQEIADNSFEVITALACLEHLANPLAAVKEAARVLKPKGIFIATCPVPFWDEIASKAGLLADDQHEHGLGKRELIRYVRSAGLSVVNFRRFMWAPVSFLPYLHLEVSITAALAIDTFIGKLKLFDWLFVNQCIVAIKEE